MTSQPPVSYETVTAPPVRRPPEMSAITEVEVSPLDPARFREALGDAFVHYEEGLAQASGLFDERAVRHVNSTARGVASPSSCNRCSPTRAEPASMPAGS